MSDTPRTDGQEFTPIRDLGLFLLEPTVSSAFARVLERELDATREQRDKLIEALRNALRFVRAYDSDSPSAMDDKWATEKQCEQVLAAMKGANQ